MAEADPQAAAAEQLSDGFSHLAAAQGVDDGVQARVEDGQGDAKFSAEQKCALAGDTEEIYQ